MPTWHLSRGRTQKSIARVQVHFPRFILLASRRCFSVALVAFDRDTLVAFDRDTLAKQVSLLAG